MTRRVLVLDADGALGEQIAGLVDQFDPAPDVKTWTDLKTVATALGGEPYHVLVAGPALGDEAGIARLQVIGEELPAMAIVLALQERPEASLRDLVRVGAIDLLQLPATDDQLEEALARALSLSLTAQSPGAAPSAGWGPT